MTASLFSTLAIFSLVGSAVFGYFAECKGVGCRAWFVGRGV